MKKGTKYTNVKKEEFELIKLLFGKGSKTQHIAKALQRSPWTIHKIKKAANYEEYKQIQREEAARYSDKNENKSLETTKEQLPEQENQQKLLEDIITELKSLNKKMDTLIKVDQLIQTKIAEENGKKLKWF